MCVTDCEPSVVRCMCECDHARQRQVLSSNRWVVVSGLSREVSRLDAGVVRRRAAVVSAPTAATERPRRHWCRGCRSDGVLWLQVGALAVCTHAVAAMRAANIGYERCRRKPMRRLDRFIAANSRGGKLSELAVCKDTRKMQTGSIATFSRSGVVRFDIGRKRSMGLVQGGKKK